ncbi:MAG: ATP/GTP-binding protein [Thermovibrio sp.]|nr:MAG: ATP/GTP-binding protein [Thermovibrio sp.]
MGIVAGISATLVFFTVLFNLSQGLKTPESAQFYRGHLYVSNIGNLPPDKKDGDGYISLADLNGKVEKVKFIKGLNAPKGITFYNGKLFVADIDRVVVADAKTGKILKVIEIPGAKFLNDTCSFRGKVYVSDTQTNVIYVIDGDTYRVGKFLQSQELQGPNGIAFTPDGKMVVVSWGGGKVLEVGKNGEIKTLASGFENLDGVVVTENGDIIFSDFSAGKVYSLKNGKVKTLISNLISPADIGYYKGKLFIPEFMMNRVKVVELRR